MAKKIQKSQSAVQRATLVVLSDMARNDLTRLERRMDTGTFLPYIKKSDQSLWKRMADAQIVSARERLARYEDQLLPNS
jgi:hypothetical protein